MMAAIVIKIIHRIRCINNLFLLVYVSIDTSAYMIK